MARTGEVITGGRLVTTVTAVIVSVTIKHGQHTFPVAALNLFPSALGLAVSLVSRDSVLVILLTVVLTIAEPGPGDTVVVVGTLPVIAGRALAGQLSFTKVRVLVRAVTAVPGAVTPPLHVDTLLAGLTLEHRLPAQVAVAAVLLILPVRTVAVSVTDPT